MSCEAVAKECDHRNDFFFQAEDGIRDLTVTVVQTCALPISPLPVAEFVAWLRREGQSRYHDQHRVHVLMHEGKLTKAQLQQWVLNRYYYQTRIPIKDALILRSEERRVGKECRSRWSGAQ